MSDQARVRLDPAHTVEDVAAALARASGERVAVEAIRGAPHIHVMTVGDGKLLRQGFALVTSRDGERPDENELSVYACDPSRETMRAVAAELGGRYRGSDYDDAWDAPALPGNAP